MNIKDFALIYKIEIKVNKKPETQEVISRFETFEEFEAAILNAPKNAHSFRVVPIA